MRTSLAISRLLETAVDPKTTTKQLAAAALQAVDRFLSLSPNGDEARALIRNQFMRQGLDEIETRVAGRANGKSVKAKSSFSTDGRRGPKTMSAEAREKISKAQTAYWKKRKAAEKKEANAGTVKTKTTSHKAKTEKELVDA